MTGPTFTAYAIATTLIALQLLALGAWTGSVRLRVKKFVNPEDAKTLKGDVAEADHPDVMRVQRAHRNALENAVPFFAIATLYTMTGASPTGAAIYFYTFVAARILHSIFYLAGLQPYRTIAFTVGALATFGMAVHVLRVSL